MNKNRRDRLAKLSDQISDIMEKLEELRDEELEAFENLPESLNSSERGETMQTAIVNKYDLVNSVWAVRMALHDVRPADSHSNKNLNRAHKLLRELIATYGTESGEEREEMANERNHS